MTSIGMNLSNPIYYSTEDPFIDRMKTTATWNVQYPSNATTKGTLQLDANGYPVAMPAGALDMIIGVGLDPMSAGTDHQYVLTWSGTGTMSVSGKVVSSKPGEIVFNQTSDSNRVAILSTDPNDPIHDIHLVRADQVSLFEQGEIFNPAFLASSSQWSVLRTMDWTRTNNSTVTSWDQRTTTQSLSWSTGAGVPIEVMVALANKTHTDLWLNIPAHANDDYVRQELSYVRDHLASGLKVDIEYSNEVWNWSFQQAGYAQSQANALWGNGSTVQGGNEIYYGYRSAQIASIADSVFGNDAATRVVNVLSTFTNYEGMEQHIFDGVARAGVGSVSSLFQNYAVTSYFGFSTGNAQDRATILSWARSGSAGLDAAFHELEYGGALSSNLSLNHMVAIYAYQEKVAQAHGLNLVAYEGGFSAYAYQFDPSVQAQVVAFYQALVDDPRMGQLYTQMANDFAAAGGSELTAFNDAGAASIYGAWGTANSIYDTSPRLQALQALAHDQPATVATSSSGYTLSDGQTALSYAGTGSFSGTGNSDNNVITGGDGGATLHGGGGNDTLVGGAGNDMLDGGIGADSMSGGAGNDIYYVDNAGDTVHELANQGTDEVRTTLASYTLGDNVENLTALGALPFTGTGNALANVITGSTTAANTLYGLAGNDTLIGGSGNDVLDGGTGADHMSGGAGNDIYIVDNAGDVVTELANKGTDEVRTSLASYALPANVENLTYTGTAAFTGTGNDLANRITGSTGAYNTLSGGAGDDTLIGGNAGNYLDGGTGADHLVGGSGNDIYVVDNVGDTYSEAPGGGIDEVRTTLASLTLGANIENLTYIGNNAFTGTGNTLGNVISGGNHNATLYGLAGNDTLIGGAGNDYLDGGTGADHMSGGAGNDVYIVDNAGDVVTELANQGTDEVRTALASYTVGANVENLTYTGTAAFTGTGNDGNNVITGSATAANHLYGMAGNDTLIGGSGADYLDGGTGQDKMIGGAGNDIYIVDRAADMVVEQPGGGTDEVRATVSYSLSANVENLTFIGTGNFNGFGNDSDNVITGGAGNDWLKGGAGNDKLIGGAGNDTYYVDDPADQVVELANEGRDVVYASVSFVLPANVEVLNLTGTAAIDGTGNSLANTINGNDAANNLYGGGGDDVLIGNGGNDHLDGGAGNDTLSGGAGNDWLVGGDGNDMLNGGDGNDRLVGGPGKDVLWGGAGADLFVFAPGDLASTPTATDSIMDFSHAEGDKIDFSQFEAAIANTTHSFKLIGDAAFSHHAGEIRVAHYGASWDVSADLNGDGQADFHLLVAASAAPTAGDFIL